MFRPWPACALWLVLSAPPLSAVPAQAQVRRCVMADGTHVYTDRACADTGASERLSRHDPRPAAGRPLRRDCSRRLQDLVFELTAAIDSRDANRLAGIYHWPGTSSRSGDAVMDRLDAIVNRPLVDISPVRPAPVPPPPPPPQQQRQQPEQTPSGALVWHAPARTPLPVASRDPAQAASDPGGDPDIGLPSARDARPDRPVGARRPPTGLVVDQVAANQVTPVQTVFRLRRHLGCWWLSL